MYVVSSLTPPELAPGEGASDLYVLDAATEGVAVAGTWHGMGLRGNGSAPMTFDLTVPEADRLGAAGAGLGLKLETIMPWFNLGNAAVSVGLSQAAVDAAITHATTARFEHLGESLAQLPTIRAQLARMSLELVATQAYLGRRKDMFRDELLIALKLVQSGTIRMDAMGSWSGAMGQTQFDRPILRSLPSMATELECFSKS